MSRLDSVTNELTTIDLPMGAGSLVPTDDAVWAVDAFGVTRIDRVDHTAQDWVTPDRGGRFQPSMSGYDAPINVDGSLWIASRESNSLVEVDIAEPAIRGEFVDPRTWSREGPEREAHDARVAERNEGAESVTTRSGSSTRRR